MRTLRTSVLFFATLVGACSGAQVPPASGGTSRPTTTTTSTNVAADIIAATNAERRKKGVRAFATSSRLMEAARLHAQQMAQFQRDAHTINGAKYPTLLSRLQAVGYMYFNAAENVAWNQRDAQAAVNSWMTSPGHRANILDPQLTEIGAAMARSSKGEPYWIQVFGLPQIPGS